MKGFIYKIESPTGRIYVGKTLHLKRRITRYKGLECVKQIKIYNSIKSHGWESHKLSIIEECDEININEREIYWINELKSFSNENPKGMNLTKGGEGNSGHRHSKESKHKQSIKKKGLNNKKLWKKVYQYSLQGDFIKEYESVTSAAKSIGSRTSTISAVCSLKKLTEKGFQWKYFKKEKILAIESANERRNIKRLKKVYAFQKNEMIAEYKSSKDASEKTGIERKNIQACCTNRLGRKKAGGIYWSYLQSLN